MKAVLFDFGGTLDTNGVHWSEKYWEAYLNLKVPVTKKEFEKAYVETLRLCETVISPEDSLFETLKRQIFLQLNYLKEIDILDSGFNIHDFTLKAAELCFSDVLKNIDKVIPVLEELKKKYRLGLVSNYHGNMNKVCDELGLTGYFSVIIDSAIVGVRKPDPEIFRLALDRLKVKAEETWVVGDSYDRDIIPSRSLGCTTIWVKGKSWRVFEDESAADFIVNSLTQLPRIIHNAGKFQPGRNDE